ncbi:MAG: hypothetical protein A3B31_02465 [Candidatus Komeilibacteria bacterium RIFCSPLOWO2_01_FULL_53_11]|uniref:Glycoside hydrolase family 57 N-terminal domain-containing protein n=1 Tax=Candidatus Komeilibacteria bacterium RIFCSPLOWO2_01_FULL_53_11 TaxID=1798552 RepID=A0A1G2BT92_9BACT|nr:MAG: hypothetical protein A3B31_02465 [Candidatus Komeilibacteria bacterium RIFCSPLOWO2_01_FULL_53_11]
MRNIKWVNFIHIYQPPWQRPEVVRQVTDESYAFLVSCLKQFPSFRLTLNIVGTLLDQLAALGCHAILTDLKRLHERGQIELTGSSYSHAFLPMLPESEIMRQIELQEAALRRFFPKYKKIGFFIPEMAYSHRVGESIKKAGYEWLILDPQSAKIAPDTNSKYIDRRTGLAVVFRNRKLSRTYPPEAIFNLLRQRSEVQEDEIIITASDGELYGHFHKDWQDHLRKILRSPRIETLSVSDHLKTLKNVSPLYLQQASWETRSRQLRRNNAFSIWFNKNNPIHKRLWQLAYLAIASVAQQQHDPNFQWARRHLDNGLASCSWWWASEIKTSVFAPIGWSPDEIERGATELIKSIRSLSKLGTREKMRAEKLFSDLMLSIWLKHWHTYGRT